MEKQHSTIDEYIRAFPSDNQAKLEEIRAIIHNVAPEATEAISYQVPTFKLKEKNLVHFAAFKEHIGFYPTPSGVIAFKEELKEYRTSKGAIQFPINKSIPISLIKRIVLFRIEEEKHR